MECKRAWLFCRASTAQGIQDQKQALLTYCQKMNWKPVKCTTILGSVKDYSNIFATNQDEKIDIMLTTHASVLGRNLLPALTFIEDMHKKGIQIATLKHEYITPLSKSLAKAIDEKLHCINQTEQEFAVEMEEAGYEENAFYDLSL